MNIVLKRATLFTISALGAAVSATALAAEPETILLKAGETVDLGSLYWVSNCRSLLTSPPVAEIMEGPPELTIAVKAQKVLPRKYNCAKPVDGAQLMLSAGKDIKSRTQGKLFIRLKYPTKDGERQGGREINYTLFPAQPDSKAEDAK